MSLVLAAPDLKRLVKKLAAVNSENTVLDTIGGVLHASDVDLTILVSDPKLQEAEAGQSHVSVNSKQFSSVVSRTSGEVNLTIAGSRLVVRAKRATFELATAVHKLAPPDPPAVRYRLPLKEVSQVLEFAASASEHGERNNFTGSVQLKAVNGRLCAAGTDHRRLAMAETPVNAVADFQLLCPVAAIQALRGLEGEELNIGETDSLLFFTTTNSNAPANSRVTIVARKLVKAFPGFDHLLQATTKFQARLDPEAMRESLKLVAPMLAEDDKGTCKVRLSFGDTLKLVAGEGTSKAEDEVDYEALQPDPLFEQPCFAIAVDHRFLVDFFAIVKSSVTLSATDPQSPVWLAAGNYRLLTATLRW